MKWIAALLLAGHLSACTSETQYGKCVGVVEQQDPSLKYGISIWNAILGMVFSETVVVPVVVLVKQTYCPEGRK